MTLFSFGGPAALYSNDAKNCYDRIMLLVAALCLCHLGCPQSAAMSMIVTIHKMEHHIWTTYGDSVTSSSHRSWKVPIAGIGQGNGAGPHIWAAVSSPMLNVMCEDGFYAHVITSILCLSKKFVRFAFVDNTNLCVHGPHIMTQNVTIKMQHSVDHWEGLLKATGGALVPTKCFWYLINFKWLNNKWQYVTSQQHPGNLSINDESQNRVCIP